MTITAKHALPLVLIVGLVAGFWLGASQHSPVNPNPPQPIKRTIAGVIRNAARLALWVTVFKPTPFMEPAQQQIVKAPQVDAYGNRVIDHAEGW
jgi:hypothetical protein